MTLFENLPKEQQERIEQHLQLVIEANERTNLTRIDTFEEGMILHVEDSLTALEDLQDAPEGLYGDLGSGGGFPGIPLAIASERQTLLIDARKKKMLILDDIIEKLGLRDRVTTYSGRAELLARSRAGEFSALTARALAKLPVLMELASPLLKRGGRLICYKANIEPEELDDARGVESLTGMKLVCDRKLVLANDYNRRIVVFEKCSKPTAKLPRQEGMAQREPLCALEK